jgi:hypothetical protein
VLRHGKTLHKDKYIKQTIRTDKSSISTSDFVSGANDFVVSEGACHISPTLNSSGDRAAMNTHRITSVFQYKYTTATEFHLANWE